MTEAVAAVTASVAAPLRGKKRWSYLSRERTLRLATLNEDGSIYLSSLWFVVVDETIYLPIDAAGRHADNMRSGRAMSALVDSGDEYTTVAGVRIIGTAEPVDDADLVESLEQVVGEKYFHEGHPLKEAYFLFGKTAGRTYFKVSTDKMAGWDTRETTTAQVTEVHELPDFVKDRLRDG
jgi:nitroimidazol reductase NimA-like FMN-containing flavoprotein (pyridoxamine 5'-phosphate oxidase superfamily)